MDEIKANEACLERGDQHPLQTMLHCVYFLFSKKIKNLIPFVFWDFQCHCSPFKYKSLEKDHSEYKYATNINMYRFNGPQYLVNTYIDLTKLKSYFTKSNRQLNQKIKITKLFSILYQLLKVKKR